MDLTYARRSAVASPGRRSLFAFARILAVLLATVALTALACGTAASVAVPPSTATMDMGHSAPSMSAQPSTVGVAGGDSGTRAFPDGGAVCAKCAEDGFDSCDGPVGDAVRNTTASPYPGAASAGGEQPCTAAPSRAVSLTGSPACALCRPPDLHLLQRLRV
ncbi:hypothetical protein [Streptomyces vastus]|uniref:Uncharacterized protein n=1 Tax=Streptomyces vastus TaxID=285451 RepID=A0ABP6DTL6_9ACTN